jgi:DNA-binding CsgD family transcriptional regulator
MNLIESILGISNNLNNYDVSVNEPGCTSFIKDSNGKYLECNNVMANIINSSPSIIFGLNDYDLLPNPVAAMLRTNDHEVMSTNTYKIYNESFASLDGSGQMMVATSIKIPYRNDKQKVVGIMGFAIIHSRNALLKKAMEEYDLTERQLECLYLLVKGNLMKQIASHLLISHRTVEHYLETIKQRMGCATKSQLIERALSIPYIKNQL